MEIDISFPGGKRVDAQFGPHLIRTDQSADAGGEGSAPEPYLLFLASLGTCAGIFVLSFCQKRGLSTEGLKLSQSMEWDPVSHKLQLVRLALHLPPGFPEKYREAVIRAADQCAVKRVLMDPPQFVIETTGG
jgi:ribosomal protein S12 methylthiotransferase accessory factor